MPSKATANPRVIWAWIVRNLERLIEELDYYQLATRRLILQVEQSIDYGWSESAAFSVETANFNQLLNELQKMHRRHLDGIPVHRMHLLADQLYRRSPRQGDLFTRRDPKWERVADAKRQINERLGRFKVRSAATLELEGIYEDESHGYDICDIRGKMCF